MNKSVDIIIEFALLIVMLAISAFFGFSTIENLSGRSSKLGDDKVVVAENMNRDEDITYYFKDLVLAIVKFDYGYPFEYMHIYERMSPSNSYDLYPKAEDTLSNPGEKMKEIVWQFAGITESDTTAIKSSKAMNVYDKEVVYSIKKDTAGHIVVYAEIQ